jgi:hypothetical protein
VGSVLSWRSRGRMLGAPVGRRGGEG